MPQQIINIGNSANDNSGDTLRSGAEKINENFTELYARSAYTLPTATQTVKGGVRIDGSTIVIDNNGIISSRTNYSLPTASSTIKGGVKVDGSTIIIDDNGVISSVPTLYELPTASTGILGGVKVDGSTITIAGGVISSTYTYTLPTASPTVKGGVKIDGTTITINNGVISATPNYTLPVATTSLLGGVKVDGSTITISNGVISGTPSYTLPVATTSLLGGVKIDGSTITIADGVISAEYTEVAVRLQTPRKINGVNFNGTADITVTANAETLTGTTLNSVVVSSSLTSVGYLNGVSVKGNPGVNVGNGSTTTFTLDVDNDGHSRLKSNPEFNLSVKDNDVLGSYAILRFTSSSDTLAYGGSNIPAIIPDHDDEWALGIPGRTFKEARINDVYGDMFHGDITGNAETATTSVKATNLNGGQTGSIPYQSAPNTTSMLAPGTAGQILVTGGPGSSPYWSSPNSITFIRGMIMLWFGASNAVPSGWALCNGQNGTPDLRDKFVVGAGSTYSIGATGGSKDSTLMSHSHTANSAVSDPGHNHDITVNDAGHSHGITDDGHSHSLWGGTSAHDFTGLREVNGGHGLLIGVRADGSAFYPTNWRGQQMVQTQSTGVSVRSARTNITASSNNRGTGISVSTSITSNGSSDGVNANLPPYMAVFYIMKL